MIYTNEPICVVKWIQMNDAHVGERNLPTLRDRGL